MRFRRRLLVLYVAFCIGLGVVWLRVGQLQVLEGDHWTRRAESARRRDEPLEAPRGRIVDARGKVLAKDEPVFQLAFIGWDWQRRGRVACPTCGYVGFYRIPEKGTPRPPKRCRCARARQSVEVASIDSEGRVPGTFEVIPTGNLRPLEKALGLAHGSLAERAAKRIDDVRGLVEQYEARQLAAGVSEFLVDDRVHLLEEDLFRRPYVFLTGIDVDAVRLLWNDEDGEYRGFRVQTALRRNHPEGDFAPQLLGFTSKVASETEYLSLARDHPDQTSRVSAVGRTGLERAYNWLLSGWPGERLMELDRDGHFTVEVESTPPRTGKTLRLSVDLEASREAEKAIEFHGNAEGYYPKGRPSGAFVMLDALSGRVLVWAEMPRFDLDKDLGRIYDPVFLQAEADREAREWIPTRALPEGMDRSLWEAELVQPAAIAKSRVATLSIEPGSALKPLVILAMLESGRPILPSFHCGTLRGPPHCHCGRVVGPSGAICFSCNQYMAAALRDYGPFHVYRGTVPRFLDGLGFGSRPSSIVREWGTGLWLRNWIDLDLRSVLERVEQRFARLHEGVKLELVPAMSRHAPATFGANPALVTQLLTDVVGQVRRESGSERVAVKLFRVADHGSEIDVRFEVRGLADAPWHRYPVVHHPSSPRAWPLTLRRAMKRAQALGGTVRIEGDLGRGGKVSVTARFDRSVGRQREDQPRIIRSNDARNVAIGQGPVLVTPLQMARAMAALANGGKRIHPSLVERVDNQRVPVDPPEDLGISLASLDLVRGGMRDVVIDGTARNAGFHRVAGTVYGKTGTAQVGRAWRPWQPRGAASEAWHHWFAGFAEAPGQRPVAFACVLHSRTEAAAGLTSAKAVADVLAWWFGR